ncbi:hypothetical protein GCM10009120_44330 [Sphingobacterium siyangense subsp. cladoniae]|uniref:S49 family peptidase n=1 Tax=Sphingobacterium siyangense TaxID=459529 RepID=UPI0031F9E403
MQKRLSANWRTLFTEDLLRGQFFISPNLSLSIPSQLLSILQNGISSDAGQSDTVHIDVKSYGYDGEEYEDLGEDSQETVVAVIPIKGTMYKYSSWYNYGMIDIADIIKAASASENVSAIVLDFDSGGGSTAAIPPLEEAIALAKARGKIIVGHGDTTCSAAYWIASLCDYIFVNNLLTSTWGSIGVMMSFADFNPYFEKLGVVFHEIYADESDEKNKIFTEALKKNYEPIKTDVLSPLAKAFQNKVKDNRGSKLKLETEGILSGKTFTGITVVNIGLADDIGTLPIAIKYAANLAIAKNFEHNY